MSHHRTTFATLLATALLVFLPESARAQAPTIVAWGYNSNGQTTVPAGLSGVTAIAAGAYHTVALKTDGTVVAWGNNGFGQTTVPAGLSGVTAIAAGFYHTVALLTTGAPTITTQPVGQTVVAGSTATFSVTATGTGPLSYQWFFNGTNLLVNATNAGLALTGVQTNQAGGYSVVITNAAGSVTSSVVALTVNRASQTVTFGTLPGKRVDDGPFSLAATASSGLPVSYSSSNPGVATVSGNTVTITGIGSTTITASQAGDAIYLPATSVDRTLAVAGIPPVIGAPPAGQAFTLGSAVTLSVGASGTGPLFYQWQFNGMNIAGANAASLALTNLSATNAGAYRVVITDAVGTVTSFPVDLYFYGDLKFIAATVLAGSIGQQYRVDYADVVTVGTTNWLVLTNITLPSSPYLVIDPNSAGRTQRYYRAVPVP